MNAHEIDPRLETFSNAPRENPEDKPSSRIKSHFQKINRAAEILAASCLNNTQKLNLENVKVILSLAENRARSICKNTIPLCEIFLNQCKSICKALLDPHNPLQQFFCSQDQAKARLSKRGKKLASFLGNRSLFSPAGLILQALFTPHRQLTLPTCAIDATLNYEIFNHPHQIALLEKQILCSDAGFLFFPHSDLLLELQEIDLNNGTIDTYINPCEANAKAFFWTNETPEMQNFLRENWHQEGILTYPSESNRIAIPIQNLHSVLLANFIHGIYRAGSHEKALAEVGLHYYGYPCDRFSSKFQIESDHTINVSMSNGKFSQIGIISPKSFDRLKIIASKLAKEKKLTAAMVFSQKWDPNNSTKTIHHGHVETLFLDKIAAIDREKIPVIREKNIQIGSITMKNEENCWIGDRNWIHPCTTAPHKLGVFRFGSGLVFATFSKNRDEYTISGPFHHTFSFLGETGKILDKFL